MEKTSSPPGQIFDADNHYYEATDAFTRFIDPQFKKRGVQWAQIDGKTRMLVGGKVFRFIPNPTFDPVAKPGALDEYFRGRNPKADSIVDAFGDLEPISPAYRDPRARIEVMDEQGIGGAFLFPTLGVGMEEALRHDPEAAHAVFHAFNLWLEDDWSLNFKDRLYAAPMISLLDPDKAVEEVEWALDAGAHVLVMRSAPAEAPTGNRSPGDPIYDPMWARINEAGVTVAYHSGDSGYHKFAAHWGEGGEMEAFRFSPLRNILSGHRPIHDTIAALVCHGVFDRFPNLRVATIESGSDWAPQLLKELGKSYGQMPFLFESDPVERMQEHVWVAPFYEDDIAALIDAIGADHVIFGSDYPHAEGLAEPRSFVNDLPRVADADVRRIMHDNGYALSQPRPA